MPRYSNTSGTGDIFYQGTRVPNQETVQQTEYLQGTLPTGLVFLDNTGFMDPIIYSAKVTSTTTITLPATTSGYKVDVYCSTGEVGLQFNDASANTVLIPATQRISRGCRSRVIDSIILTISSGTAYVTVTVE